MLFKKKVDTNYGLYNIVKYPQPVLTFGLRKIKNEFVNYTSSLTSLWDTLSSDIMINIKYIKPF